MTFDNLLGCGPKQGRVVFVALIRAGELQPPPQKKLCEIIGFEEISVESPDET